jgi:Na+/melibiose symporter-like transporter
MTNTLAIPAAIAGAALLVPKLSAVLMDTAFGVMAERLPMSWRKRRPFLIAGGCLTALSFILLFRPPDWTDPLLLCAYIFVGFFLANAALSAMTVSYLSLAFDVAEESRQRTVLMSWRVALHMSGVLIGGLAPALVGLFGDGRVGYAWMGVTVSAICICGVLINYLSAARTPVQAQRVDYARLADLKAVFARPNSFRKLVCVYGLQYFSNGIQYAAHAYMAIFIVGGDLEFLSTLVVIMTLSSLVVQPVWIRIADRIGKHATYTIAAGSLGIVFLCFALLGRGDRELAYGISVLQGIFAGGGALMAWSLFLDTIETYGREKGIDRPEMLSGIWSALEKASFAIGVFIFGIILQSMGLIPSTNLNVMQPDSAILGIRIGVGILPCVGMVASAFLIYVWLRQTKPVAPL